MNGFLTKYYYFFLVFLLVGVILASFYIGFLLGERQKSDPVVLQCSDAVLANLKVPVAAIAKGAITAETQKKSTGAFVGSKNGTKYYRPHCGAVKRIKKENYIWFTDAQDAQLQGYTAGTC